jgi:hypothetical protein
MESVQSYAEGRNLDIEHQLVDLEKLKRELRVTTYDPNQTGVYG